MNMGRILTLVVLCVAVAVDAEAQQLPSVVQLPSFRTFSYSGTVVVPDSGAAYLGGNRSSATGASRGRSGRGFGFAQTTSQLSARASIIDHGEIDRQLLGGTPQDLLNAPRRKGVNLANPTEEGKALVRYARKLYREGEKSAAFDTYQMAIAVLTGRLRGLAEQEFRRVFGSAADQSLRMASRRR